MTPEQEAEILAKIPVVLKLENCYVENNGQGFYVPNEPKPATPTVADLEVLLGEIRRLRGLIEHHNATMALVRHGVHSIDMTAPNPEAK